MTISLEVVYLDSLMLLINLTFQKILNLRPYASIRIRGAIVDELRVLDWVPRSVRKKSIVILNVHLVMCRQSISIITQMNNWHVN